LEGRILANKKFHIFKLSDKKLVSALKNIATNVCDEIQNVNLTFFLAENHSQPISTSLEQINKNETIQEIISQNSTLLWRVVTKFPKVGNASIIVQRQECADEATIDFPNDIGIDMIVPLIAAAHKELKAYERTESTDKLLGNELAEFYRRREQGLLRLEELTQDLIQQNIEFRNQLNNEILAREKQLQADYASNKEELQADYEDKLLKLTKREEELEQRKRDLDDQDSRHARRQIRKDLKDALAQRSEEFTLTPKTTGKRKPIHALFLSLIGITTILFIVSLFYQVFHSVGVQPWYILLRLPLSALALAAAIVFWIRWNDQWFRQHADEEFRLKRFELDIDRASWIVEMATDWQEKGIAIPKELVERLSRNLFTDKPESEAVKHPNEVLTSALLAASSGLTVKIPGLGEVAVDRKGIRDFKKTAASLKNEKKE